MTRIINISFLLTREEAMYSPSEDSVFSATVKFVSWNVLSLFLYISDLTLRQLKYLKKVWKCTWQMFLLITFRFCWKKLLLIGKGEVDFHLKSVNISLFLTIAYVSIFFRDFDRLQTWQATTIFVLCLFILNNFATVPLKLTFLKVAFLLEECGTG